MLVSDFKFLVPGSDRPPTLWAPVNITYRMLPFVTRLFSLFSVGRLGGAMSNNGWSKVLLFWSKSGFGLEIKKNDGCVILFIYTFILQFLFYCFFVMLYSEECEIEIWRRERELKRCDCGKLLWWYWQSFFFSLKLLQDWELCGCVYQIYDSDGDHAETSVLHWNGNLSVPPCWLLQLRLCSPNPVC